MDVDVDVEVDEDVEVEVEVEVVEAVVVEEEVLFAAEVVLLDVDSANSEQAKKRSKTCKSALSNAHLHSRGNTVHTIWLPSMSLWMVAVALGLGPEHVLRRGRRRQGRRVTTLRSATYRFFSDSDRPCTMSRGTAAMKFCRMSL